MLYLYLDLETIPAQRQWIKDEITVSPPGNIKKPESIQKWHTEHSEKAWIEKYLKTSFDGSSGEICTIGYALNDDVAKAFQRSDLVTEGDILQEFFDTLADYARDDHKTPEQLSIQWIGHNVIAFDLRFLYQRCVINNIDTYGIKVPVDARHGSKHVYDTMIAWQGWKAQSGGSLDRLCRLFGLDGKGDMDGSKVWPMFQETRYKEIAEYCMHDVELTREVYKILITC